MKLFFATFFVCVFSLSIFAQDSPKSAASPEPVNPAVKEKAAPVTAIIPAASVKEITGLQKDVQIANLQAGNLQLQIEKANAELVKNIKAGTTYRLKITQDGTGGRTWTPPTTFKYPGGISGNILTTTANAVDVFICETFDGTNLWCNGLFDVKNP